MGNRKVDQEKIRTEMMENCTSSNTKKRRFLKRFKKVK